MLPVHVAVGKSLDDNVIVWISWLAPVHRGVLRGSIAAPRMVKYPAEGAARGEGKYVVVFVFLQNRVQSMAEAFILYGKDSRSIEVEAIPPTRTRAILYPILLYKNSTWIF